MENWISEMANMNLTLGGGPAEAAPASSPVCDWLVRVQDGENLFNSLKFRVWGCKSWVSNNKGFLRRVQPGDRLWFVQSNSKGKLVGVATFKYQSTRVLGPLVSVWTDEELGWSGSEKWDTLIHYTDFYDLRDCKNLLTEMKGQGGYLQYSPGNCKVVLPQIYPFVTLLAGTKRTD